MSEDIDNPVCLPALCGRPALHCAPYFDPVGNDGIVAYRHGEILHTIHVSAIFALKVGLAAPWDPGFGGNLSLEPIGRMYYDAIPVLDQDLTPETNVPPIYEPEWWAWLFVQDECVKFTFEGKHKLSGDTGLCSVELTGVTAEGATKVIDAEQSLVMEECVDTSRDGSASVFSQSSYYEGDEEFESTTLPLPFGYGSGGTSHVYLDVSCPRSVEDSSGDHRLRFFVTEIGGMDRRSAGNITKQVGALNGSYWVRETEPGEDPFECTIELVDQKQEVCTYRDGDGKVTLRPYEGEWRLDTEWGTWYGAETTEHPDGEYGPFTLS